MNEENRKALQGRVQALQQDIAVVKADMAQKLRNGDLNGVTTCALDLARKGTESATISSIILMVEQEAKSAVAEAPGASTD